MKPEPCLVSPARLKRGGVARARSTSALDATIDPLCSSSSSMPDELLSYFISAATRFHITLSTRRFLHRGYFLPAGSDLPSSTRHLFRWTVRHSWPCGGRHRALSGVSQAASKWSKWSGFPVGEGIFLDPHPSWASNTSRTAINLRKLHTLLLMGRIPHVGIVGAGLSGLRCADVLIQNGIRVTILEARDRVGGRVCQSELGGRLVDLGPNWIHGTVENPISDIADISKTTVHEWDGRQSIFDVSGKLYDDSMATKITEFMWTTIDKAFEYSNKYKDAIPSDKSLLDFFYEQVEKTDFTQAEKDACIEVARLWGSYVGDPIERQSLKFFLLEECIDGNNLFVASTYKDILKHVSATATQHADIHLNEPVVGIEAHPRQPNVDHQVTVTTAAGKQYKFDDVVVTCPLGWLKRNKGAFTPKLPPRLLSAIDSISYGRLEKIYVTFPDAFWHVTPGRPSSATGDANGATEVFYESHPEENHPPAFSIFLNPSYAEHPNEIPWNQESVSLAALPEHCAQPTLLFYIYGPCATQVVSEIKDLDSSSEMYYTFLNNFLLPYYSRLPRYSPTSPNCKPVAFLATQWQNDPYAGNGSYSNFQVGLEQGDRDIEVLRNGNGIGPDRGVWFAGEHTAPFVALGTTTGAYWSGERAAAQICDAYGLKEKVGLGNVRDDSLPSAVPKGTHAGALDPAAPEWSGRKQHETDHGV